MALCCQRESGANAQLGRYLLPRDIGGVMRGLISFLVLLSSAPAAAAPTYLACTVDQGDGPLAVEVTADETEQRATVLLPSTGRVVTVKALFSPAEVNILDDVSTWVVDRVNLGFQRIVTIGDHRSVYSGSCKIKPAPPKRAF